MASFDPIWDATDEFEGGFQQLVADNGNYCPAKGKQGSQLIGTKYGISAIGYAQYYGKCPTVTQIKNLSKADAKKIAKQQYFDQIQGSKIKSQAIAHLIFDITFGGSTGPKQVRQAINAIKGNNTVSEFASFTLSDKEIDIINALPEKQLFDKITQIRKNWLIGNTYQTSLTNRINKLITIYGPTLKNTIASTKKYIIPLTLLSIALATGLFLIIKNNNK